jgi:hypothetical protein
MLNEEYHNGIGVGDFITDGRFSWLEKSLEGSLVCDTTISEKEYFVVCCNDQIFVAPKTKIKLSEKTYRRL